MSSVVVGCSLPWLQFEFLPVANMESERYAKVVKGMKTQILQEGWRTPELILAAQHRSHFEEGMTQGDLSKGVREYEEEAAQGRLLLAMRVQRKRIVARSRRGLTDQSSNVFAALRGDSSSSDSDDDDDDDKEEDEDEAEEEQSGEEEEEEEEEEEGDVDESKNSESDKLRV